MRRMSALDTELMSKFTSLLEGAIRVALHSISLCPLKMGSDSTHTTLLGVAMRLVLMSCVTSLSAEFLGEF